MTSSRSQNWRHVLTPFITTGLPCRTSRSPSSQPGFPAGRFAALYYERSSLQDASKPFITTGLSCRTPRSPLSRPVFPADTSQPFITTDLPGRTSQSPSSRPVFPAGRLAAFHHDRSSLQEVSHPLHHDRPYLQDAS